MCAWWGGLRCWLLFPPIINPGPVASIYQRPGSDGAQRSIEAASSTGRSISTHAWAVVALLWPVAMLNYLDRQMLSTMGLSMKLDIVELQSAHNFGRLMAVFLWVYAFCSPLGGIVAAVTVARPPTSR